MASRLTFSTRAFNVGEIELSDRAAKGDLSAGIDLLVSRSEPKVTREYVCTFSIEEYTEAFHELGKSVAAIGFLQKLFGQVKSDEEPTNG